jgi:hypothetical protein
MKRLHLFLLVITVVAVSACQPAATSTPETRQPLATRAPVSGNPATATAEPLATIGAAAAADWQLFTSAEGGFSLLLPGKPTEQKQPVETNTGTIDAVMYITEVDGTAYGAGFSDFPGETSAVDPADVLAGARDGAVQNVNGTVVDEKPIELSGYPGLEIAIELPADASAPDGAMYRARLYLIGNRLYQVIYVALKPADNPDDYQKLFDSFQLENSPEPPSPTPSASLSDWIEYRSDKGGFSVLLPKQPQEQTDLIDTTGGTTQMTMALIESDDFAAGVSYNDIPQAALNGSDAAALLKGGREGTAKNLKGQLVSDKPISLGAYSGTEFAVTAPGDILYQARAYVVGKRLYQVIFIAPQDKVDQFDVQAFFDSFTLLEK